MKRALVNKIIIGHLFLFVLILYGCVTVEQTIYLGDVEVDAPIISPPLHVRINKEIGDVTISPRFAILTSENKISGSTDTKYTGTFKINDSTFYKANKQNLYWTPYEYTLGLDIDLKVSKTISLFGGINLSGKDNNSSTGGNLGVGFHNDGERYIARLDAGLTIQNYNFTAVTIVQTKTTYVWGDQEEHWNIFADRGNSTNINPFVTLTVNSSYEKSLFNWYVSGGYFTQNLLGFKPGNYTIPLFFPLPIGGTYTQIDKRSDMIAGFIYFNPGISLAFSHNINFLLSTKIMNEVLSSTSKQWYIMPSLQFDFRP